MVEERVFIVGVCEGPVRGIWKRPEQKEEVVEATRPADWTGA